MGPDKASSQRSATPPSMASVGADALDESNAGCTIASETKAEVALEVTECTENVIVAPSDCGYLPKIVRSQVVYDGGVDQACGECAICAETFVPQSHKLSVGGPDAAKRKDASRCFPGCASLPACSHVFNGPCIIRWVRLITTKRHLRDFD